ncbi:MAG: dihydroorotase [Myxococcales bacterium]|nr:dihydroorotase [Myxococcales bacterium]
MSILLFHSDGRLLMQRRSLTKDESPGLLGASASGHVGAGEDVLETALREFSEELGVDAPPLHWLGKLSASVETAQEFMTVYAARTAGIAGVADGASPSFLPDPGEVAGLEWLAPDAVRALLVHEPERLSGSLRAVLAVFYDAARSLAAPSWETTSYRFGDGTSVLREPAFDLLIVGGSVVTPGGILRADVGIRAGRIAAIGSLAEAATEDRLDATGLHVLPGAIDTQVHFREPGLEHKEDIGSGSASAVLGGVTAFMEMPNTKPSTTTAELLAWKVARAKATSWADFAFFVGACPENADITGELERLPGAAGIKVFMGSSTGSLLVDDLGVLEAVLRSGRRRVAVHAEDERRLEARRALACVVADHPVWRDEIAAVTAVEQLLPLARRVGRPVHVLHVTSRGELPLLAAYKDIASFEVTPQHLTFAAPECYERLGTLAQMNPPIRGEEHRAALWWAVNSGLVDVIGSDHAPHSIEEKSQSYPNTPSGMPGVQTLLTVILDHVAAGRLSLERAVDLTAAGPARVYGLARKGRIAVGYDADLALVDLAARRTFTREMAASRCGWSPFEGVTFQGVPVATIVRGRLVMRDGELIGSPSGQALNFVGVPGAERS